MNDRSLLAQDGHIVNILPPVNVTGGTTAQAFSMAQADHADIILLIGADASGLGTITVQAGTATAAVGATVAGAAAIPFSVWKQETAGASKDVLGVRTAVASAGFSPSANANIFYVIGVNANDLPAGSNYVQLVLANGANTCIAGAVAILTGLGYAGESNPTATA
jgi:hypothetical protein